MSTAAKSARSRLPHSCSLGALAVGVVLLAGCGSSSSSSSSSSPATPAAPSTAASTPATAASSTLALAAAPGGELKYDQTSLSAKAGTVTINFTNSSPVGHNVTVASDSGSVVGETPTFNGGSKTLSLNLKPGTYKFFCSVPGHRAAGMEGTLTVQ